jgi:N6-L-threonylcarbamoyladenine synthase
LPTILAIESSCDDTSAAVLQDGKILSNVVSSQKVHVLYGGVVPEVASRQHQENITPVVAVALKEAGIEKENISAIAVTKGPGLLGSLLVGVSYAKGLALALDKPLIGIHHMHAHILSHFAEPPFPPFPFLCLTVSGGHTQIVQVNSPLDMIILGQTIDDAAGEAFDKTGKMMGLGYPAGPEMDRRAALGEPKFEFSEPRMQGYDFSFSGFKTSVLYFLRDAQIKNENFISEHLNDLCTSIQQAIIKILMNKLDKAVKETGIHHVAIAGGVAANSGLRNALFEREKKYGWKIFIPAFQFCTDNAAMIAVAAQYKYEAGLFEEMDMTPDPRYTF